MKKPVLSIRYRVKNGNSQIHTGGPLKEQYWSNFNNGSNKIVSSTYVKDYMKKRNPAFTIRIYKSKTK